MRINNSVNQNFKMAFSIDDKAVGVIKQQLSQMSPKKQAKMIDFFEKVQARQAENPVDIIIEKTKAKSNKICATIYDNGIDRASLPLAPVKIKQCVFSKKGFIRKAEKIANAMNTANERLKNLIIISSDNIG